MLENQCEGKKMISVNSVMFTRSSISWNCVIVMLMRGYICVNPVSSIMYVQYWCWYEIVALYTSGLCCAIHHLSDQQEIIDI